MDDTTMQEIAKRHAAKSEHAYARDQGSDWKAHDWVISAMREAASRMRDAALAVVKKAREDGEGDMRQVRDRIHLIDTDDI